ncbi:MAG TPA: 4Fe-4S cluster-binding domain-containing protein [Gemmataceae bacterium]|nr:4Fe-4S cluster-binding domain-containing protein [Gemmataceae bacterium]
MDVGKGRGDDQRTFPWGETPPLGWNRPQTPLANVGAKGTCAIGSYQRTRSPYGCEDLIGNVSEWCQPTPEDDPSDAIPQGIEGITLLGGEPTSHAAGASRLAKQVRAWNLSVMVFSGFTLEELKKRQDPKIEELLAHTDILVDGPYRRDLPEKQRRWIGSANQRIFFLTDRYRADDPCWRMPNTLEIRLVGSAVSVNGFPVAKLMVANVAEPIDL